MSGTVNGNRSTEYVGLNPGVSDVEIAAMAAGFNANSIVYQPTPPGLDAGQTDVPDIVPDSTWLKSEIEQWLTNNEIAYPVGSTKAELLALVP